MKITKEQLKKWKACQEGYKWFCGQKLIEHKDICKQLSKEDHYKWAYWLITRIIDDKKELVSFAIYAAEQVLPIFEKKYPDDKRPREAIEATKKYLKTGEIDIAYTAAVAADDAAYAAYAAAAAAAAVAAYAVAAYAADAAADTAAAYAAAYAADAAADAADAAAYAADDAAAAAADAADAADAAAAYAADAVKNNKEIKDKILNYGLALIEERLYENN